MVHEDCNKTKRAKPGLVTSFNAAYVIDEVKSILKDTDLKNYKISKETMGLTIIGIKADSN